MPSLLVFSRDPGATNQLVAVLERLTQPPRVGESDGLAALRDATACGIDAVRIAARGPGAGFWREAGWDYSLWQGVDARAASDLLDESDACAILTGTSDIDEDGDRLLWRVARKRGISSHAVLDHPANLAARFRERTGERVLPDWLYAPDSVFAERLVAADIPSERIRVIGDLHHARMRELAGRTDSAEIERLRKVWGADSSTTVVLFASECGREMTKAGRPSPYDEIDTLCAMLRSVAMGDLPSGERVQLKSLLVLIRPHPRDLPGKYECLIREYRSSVRIAKSAEGSPHLALMAADLVVGMNSSLLYEAFELGRPVCSLTGHNLAAGKSRVG